MNTYILTLEAITVTTSCKTLFLLRFSHYVLHYSNFRNYVQIGTIIRDCTTAKPKSGLV